MSHGRRTFLNLQIEISQSATIEEMWENIQSALERLNFDMAEMVITPQGYDHCAMTPAQPQAETGEDGRMTLEWRRPGLPPDKKDFLCSRALLKLELPLMGTTGQVMGSLWLVKSLADDPHIDFTLRRVEHLRRIRAASKPLPMAWPRAWPSVGWTAKSWFSIRRGHTARKCIPVTGYTGPPAPWCSIPRPCPGRF